MNQKSLDHERQWIQALLSEWGVWRRQDEDSAIPARWRLRTGGEDIQSTEEGLELTNLAVMHLREVSRLHYWVIKAIYKDFPGERYGYILRRQPEGMDLDARRLSEMRREAESKIASFRQGAAAA